MNNICWCNSCYARRFNDDDSRKFDDCEIQQALDTAYEENEKLRVQLEEERMWNQHGNQSNG